MSSKSEIQGRGTWFADRRARETFPCYNENRRGQVANGEITGKRHFKRAIASPGIRPIPLESLPVHPPPTPRPFEIAELFSRLNVSLRPPGIALR